MTVITRFAPSPTGYLHIGGARTALFNYLFAKNHGGKFLLRIEDTDKERSTKQAKEAILSSLKWLNINHDDQVIYQSERQERHQEIAKQLVELGKAYYCFTPQDEINQLREKARLEKKHFIFRSPWRDKSASEHPKDIKPVVRLKVPEQEEILFEDELQGKIVIKNSEIEDLILVRSNGTPTYMLAVVVDDHDMGITHIIRGDDHLSNAPKQQLIYQALDWDMPKMIHIPLIHGQDGAKLSKRHGALGAGEYRKMGYLPSALNNYLLRLGWSHGDDEIISREQAIKWFGINGLGKSSARLDFNKMKHLNSTYLRNMNNDVLAKMIFDHLGNKVSDESKKYVISAIESMKPRAELLTDLYDLAKIYMVDDNIEISPEAKEIIDDCNVEIIKEVIEQLENIDKFDSENIKNCLKELAKANEMKLGELMKYIRALITGRTSSPSVFEIMAIIGKNNSIGRLK